MPFVSYNLFVDPSRYTLYNRRTVRTGAPDGTTMASGPQTFTICTVFSPERFKGNPLAIVSVRGNAIPQQRKSLIAKEFGYSETVFIHDAPSPGEPRRLDIFTEQGEEIPFAGHPVIGAAHYIFFFCERFVPSSGTGRGETERQHAVFLTKAGPVPVYFNPYRQVAACSVPYNIHLHKDRVSLDRVLAIQPQIQIVPTYDALKERTYPVVSGVKGMTFALIDLTDAPNVLGALKPSDSPEYELDENWAPSFKGAFYYKRTQEMAHDNEPTIHAIQARMITQGIEDPGTGSACCALACYLALDGMEDPQEAPKESNVQDTSAEDELSQKTAEVKLEDKEASDLARERHVYAIHQGVEMGRQCTIAVEVETVVGKDGAKRVANVTLSGRANFFATGQLLAHP